MKKIRPTLIQRSASIMLLMSLLWSKGASAEPASCLSSDPNQWPSPSKPYFMFATATSTAMGVAVGTAPTCSGFSSTRIGHVKCSLRNTFQLYSGLVNFGLAGFARGTASACTATCADLGGGDGNGTCGWANYTGGGTPLAGCGPEPTAQPNSEDRRGAEILVPMQRDNFYSPPLDASNLPELLKWVDNDCSMHPSRALSYELWANGNHATNGILRDVYRYLSTQWTSAAAGGPTFPTPIATSGERSCRPINVILISTSDEACDNAADAVDAANDLFNTGFNIGPIGWRVRTYVISLGGTTALHDQIAAAGGTGTAYAVTNESSLSSALSTIIQSAIKSETCDNADNNCNGCTDEGFTHYCNTGQTCCAWSSTAQRAGCLATYQASITAANPKGDTSKLPCTTATDQADPNRWLCYNPGEMCDNVDNNCSGGVDEGVTKCGNPAHCPQTETCNGLDDNCNGTIDEGVCGGGCIPSPEVCDGCDNDCDGLIDEGIASVPCGLASPANCAGTQVCAQKPNPGGVIGACVGGSWNACSNNPQTEVCDGIDNDCDGIVDDNITATPCVPAGTPGGLSYAAGSQCKMGKLNCGGTCVGFVGPSAEVCDGIDNDCDGQVDENPQGVGQPCGSSVPPCTPGVTVCDLGALVCQGATGAQPEKCDGIDNDCNGVIDDGALSDAPLPGQNGCWNLPGNCCTFGTLNWCPPAGASCADNGALVPPCGHGTLSCVSGGWVCSGVTVPGSEVCDGIDNNCNGSIDDGPLPSVGSACGSDVGECETGTLACVNGALSCSGIVPTTEICDGKDNDCDGVVDNNASTGTACDPVFDTMLYPGTRNLGACHQGVSLCDASGTISCVGAVAPSPEVCDGIDNDCDGLIDELGSAPDGIDGTENPLSVGETLGSACGLQVGSCSQGVFTCVQGKFACVGAVSPKAEICNGIDDDCDGIVDNSNGAGVPPLCGTGQSCVEAGGGYQCARPCDANTLCAIGQVCQPATDAQTGAPAGDFCIADLSALCGDCSTQHVTNANGEVVCAPAGTVLPNCETVAECICAGQNGCREPCFGVTCNAGETCAPSGPQAGSCVPNDCGFTPCQGCDLFCHTGTCLVSPCQPGVCDPALECKPSADWTSASCVSSCGGVICNPGFACKEGQCLPSCDPECGPGLVCDTNQNPPVCVATHCDPNPCPPYGYCDPLTGACVDEPCAGVLCPDGQTCALGECTGGTAGTGGSGGSAGTGATSGSAGAGNSGTGGTSGVGGIAGTAGNAGTSGNAGTGGSGANSGSAGAGATGGSLGGNSGSGGTTGGDAGSGATVTAGTGSGTGGSNTTAGNSGATQNPGTPKIEVEGGCVVSQANSANERSSLSWLMAALSALGILRRKGNQRVNARTSKGGVK